MTLPDSIKKEIEQEAEKMGDRVYPIPKNIKRAIACVASQFYARNIADRDAIAIAAMMHLAKHLCDEEEVQTLVTLYFSDFLASDEYKKLVGER